MKTFNYDKNKLYIVGVSGGPDSMALLDMLFNQQYNLVVCLVNYNTRKESSYEQNMVKEYCFSRNIIFETIDVLYYKKYGNFEAWARNIRYKFFKETLNKYQGEAIFVAHHKDDLLETYLMQKQRKIITKYFGLKEKTTLYDVPIIRPLLDFYKDDLINYCINEKIEYSIDSTNLENKHLRNKIRNNILSKYDNDQKEQLLLKIKQENNKRNENVIKVNKLLQNDKISIEEFLNLDPIEKQLLLYDLITTKIDDMNSRLSWYRINEFIKVLQSNKPNVCIKISGLYYFIREYNLFYVDKLDSEERFIYKMNEPGILNVNEFSCDFNIDTSELKIYPESYPLTFRNVKKEDEVLIGKIKKRVNRLLIDEKVPLTKRKRYPIVLDKNNKIVYIPLYRSEIQKKIANKLKFVLK